MTNYIFGKVKRKRKMFRIINTDEDVYDVTDQSLTGVDYNPSTLIEDEELYQISNFSTSGFILDFLLDDIDSVNHDQITKVDLKKLSFICTKQESLYFFQVINSSLFISKKWFSIDELTLETEKPIVTINPFADAIYNKENDTLYFKKLTAAQRVFKGMDQLYREATDAETQTFLDNDFLDIGPAFNSRNVTIPNRKRIALVNETLSTLTAIEKQAIYDYTNEYGRVTYQSGKFKIENDEDLKFVLWGIEQRFYTTPISHEKRVANSIITI